MHLPSHRCGCWSLLFYLYGGAAQSAAYSFSSAEAVIVLAQCSTPGSEEVCSAVF